MTDDNHRNDPLVEKHDGETRFRNYTAYRCNSCLDDCINRRDTVAARYQECKRCASVPDLDTSTDPPAANDDGGTSIPSVREPPSRRASEAKPENTAFLAEREVSDNAIELEDFPRAPRPRPRWRTDD